MAHAVWVTCPKIVCTDNWWFSCSHPIIQLELTNAEGETQCCLVTVCVKVEVWLFSNRFSKVRLLIFLSPRQANRGLVKLRNSDHWSTDRPMCDDHQGLVCRRQLNYQLVKLREWLPGLKQQRWFMSCCWSLEINLKASRNVQDIHRGTLTSTTDSQHRCFFESLGNCVHLLRLEILWVYHCACMIRNLVSGFGWKPGSCTKVAAPKTVR